MAFTAEKFPIRKELKRIVRSGTKREWKTLQNIYIGTVSSETPMHTKFPI
jgi:hypothetical protein